MKLFIQIKDGTPVNHPIAEENFYQAFPHIDINNLPPEFAPFERVLEPAQNNSVRFVHNGYSLVGKVYQDTWAAVPLTDAEIAAQSNDVIQRKIEVSRVSNS